ncbi:hypothetical protein HK100_000655 [Physocladia obscura]|uniref:Uncharacterized protein n=1 Tax=Physocladia obscura TaxID=109957 RepID=A0AAD5SYB6_9FUNG|nr:hypothetical protein HK100_000655 [Physocladia obscura]
MFHSDVKFLESLQANARAAKEVNEDYTDGDDDDDDDDAVYEGRSVEKKNREEEKMEETDADNLPEEDDGDDVYGHFWVGYFLAVLQRDASI